MVTCRGCNGWCLAGQARATRARCRFAVGCGRRPDLVCKQMARGPTAGAEQLSAPTSHGAVTRQRRHGRLDTGAQAGACTHPRTGRPASKPLRQEECPGQERAKKLKDAGSRPRWAGPDASVGLQVEGRPTTKRPFAVPPQNTARSASPLQPSEPAAVSRSLRVRIGGLRLLPTSSVLRARGARGTSSGPRGWGFANRRARPDPGASHARLSMRIPEEEAH